MSCLYYRSIMLILPLLVGMAVSTVQASGRKPAPPVTVPVRERSEISTLEKLPDSYFNERERETAGLLATLFDAVVLVGDSDRRAFIRLAQDFSETWARILACNGNSPTGVAEQLTRGKPCPVAKESSTLSARIHYLKTQLARFIETSRIEITLPSPVLASDLATTVSFPASPLLASALAQGLAAHHSEIASRDNPPSEPEVATYLNYVGAFHLLSGEHCEDWGLWPKVTYLTILATQVRTRVFLEAGERAMGPDTVLASHVALNSLRKRIYTACFPKTLSPSLIDENRARGPKEILRIVGSTHF